jgi:hypothetical protein
MWLCYAPQGRCGMTPEQSAAFINSQTACALIEMQGMVAMNVTASKNHRGYSHFVPPYSQSNFLELIDKYGLGYNTVVEYLRMFNP